MAKNLNLDPYYDDFAEEKNFHQILFKPGYAVQSRELTQLQSILKNQIEKFGNHIFKHGSVVIPGNSFSDLNVPYVKVESLYSGLAINLSLFKGQVVVGSVSGIRAVVQKAVAATVSDPITFYLSYLSGGVTSGAPNGKLVFDASEDIFLENQSTIRATTKASAATGVGSLAYVNKGVYYINGSFVTVLAQSVVLSKYTTTPSCHVLLKITESFVDSVLDESLLDPAQGSYNYSAPGADRFKINLTLTTLDYSAAVTSDYVELMRFNAGVLEEHARYPKYNELDKALARRTFDESGNYIVNGYGLGILEHARLANNGGVYIGGDTSKLVYALDAGKAYLNGFGLEDISANKVAVDKARTNAHVFQTSATLKPSYGQYLLIAAPAGTLNISTREQVTFFNISANTGGSSIGTANVLSMEYLVGDGTNPIYKLFLSNLTMTGNIEDIGSVRTATPFYAKVVAEYIAPITSGSFAVNDIVNFNSTIRTATVAFYNSLTGLLYAHKHSATVSTPKVGDTIVGATATTTILKKTNLVSIGQASCVFRLPQKAIKALKNSSNSFDMGYSEYRQLSIASGATTTSTVTGTIQSLDVGSFIAINAAGIDSVTNYTLGGSGTSIVRTSNAPSTTAIYCKVAKTTATPKTKTSTIVTGQTAASALTVTLANADVYEITSVVFGGVDIKSYYTLDNGQTDFEYGLSKLILKNGITMPVGTLTIAYKYFAHTTGDFFSVDSYSGIALENILPYFSQMTGDTYNLGDCIDFRKSYGANSNLVVEDSILTSSVQRYVPRIDSICLNENSDVVVLSGTPAEFPKPPTVTSSLFELYQVRIPAYTFDINDVQYKKVAPVRYTMKDVQKLENRILNLEDFSTATEAEIKLIKTPIIDAASGLDRYKTGYLVENMTNPFGIAEAYRSEFAVSMNATDGIFAQMEVDSIPLTLTAGNTAQVKLTNGFLTLPFVEVPFAQVGVSSRTTNLNPFGVVKWEGNMNLTPPSALWVEVVDLPQVLRSAVQYEYVGVWQPAPTPSSNPAPAVSTPGAFVIGPSLDPPQPVQVTPVNTSVVVSVEPAPAAPIASVSTPAPATTVPDSLPWWVLSSGYGGYNAIPPTAEFNTWGA